MLKTPKNMKLTNEQFLLKAREIHGNKYNYLEDYSVSTSAIQILCEEHGVFTQTPKSHMRGANCPKCALILRKVNRKTHEQFVADSIKKHGGLYEYPEQYKDTTTKISIICKEHGEFKQAPGTHLSGCGCPKCGLLKNTRAISVEEFKRRAEEKFGRKFKYDLSNYRTIDSVISVLCDIHGEVKQTASSHLKSKGCRLCSFEKPTNNLSHEDFLARCKEVYGDKFQYPEKYAGMGKKIRISCPEHGDFYQTPMVHLANHIKKNLGCPKCAAEWAKTNQRKDTAWFIARAKETHGDRYDYSKSEYITSNDKLWITCNDHGEFHTNAGNHLQGSKCPKCAHSDRLAATLEDRRNHFLSRVEEHPYKVVDISQYVRNTSKLEFVCQIHGVFKQYAVDLVDGHGCQKCSITKSNQETILYELLKSLDLNIIRRDRSGIAGTFSNGKLELDFLLPDYKLAIEVDGNYWHSTVARPGDLDWAKNHMNKKRLTCQSNGHRLLRFYADEVQYQTDVVFNIIKANLGLLNQVAYARNTCVVDLEWQGAKEFLNQHHLQKSGKRAKAKGLLSGGELIAVMLFDKTSSHRGNKDDGIYELIRFSSKGRVVGGCSKLLQDFLKNTSQCKKVISYSDNRYSDGKVYEALGFNLAWETEPDYMYVKRPFTLRYHKSGFRRAKLEKLLPDFDPALTERENCHRNKIYQLYNCGLKRWEMQV